MIQADQPTIFDKNKLRVAVSSRTDGSVGYLEPALSRTANIARVSAYVDAQPEHTAVMDVAADQLKWDTILEVNDDVAGVGVNDHKTRIVADVLVTKTPGLALLLPIADCCPAVIHDPINNVLALAHLGWQSTNVDLASKVVRFLMQEHQSNPTNIQVYLGPCIKAESYIVEGAAQESDPRWQPFLRHTSSGTSVDIVGFNVAGLKSAGVLGENIQICPTDTATSLDYFSHYRASRSDGEEPEGRFAAVCVLA
jgi:copper oxidase (laccase) domain-containing protein